MGLSCKPDHRQIRHGSVAVAHVHEGRCPPGALFPMMKVLSIGHRFTRIMTMRSRCYCRSYHQEGPEVLAELKGFSAPGSPRSCHS